jgi:hypothetical protein
MNYSTLRTFSDLEKEILRKGHFVNLGLLSTMVSSGKRPGQWMKLSSTKRLIADLEGGSAYGTILKHIEGKAPCPDLFFENYQSLLRGREDVPSGYWVHPVLALWYLSWLQS